MGCGGDREVTGGHWPPLQGMGDTPLQGMGDTPLQGMGDTVCRGGQWPPETYDHHRCPMDAPHQDPLVQRGSK